MRHEKSLKASPLRRALKDILIFLALVAIVAITCSALYQSLVLYTSN